MQVYPEREGVEPDIASRAATAGKLSRDKGVWVVGISPTQRSKKTVRSTIAVLGICLGSLICELAYAETASGTIGPATPRVYALIAAIGEQFNTLEAVATTGTHLSPYRRKTEDVPNNVLNRFALHSLDKAIKAIEPASTRVYLSLPAAQMDGVSPSTRDSVAMGAIVAALENMPQRMAWHRIVVVTPAYRALDQSGLPGKLQGFGVFSEPRCQAGCDYRRPTIGEQPDGVDALTSEDKTIKARTFLAPFSYVTVWVLDPRTLAVLDRQQSFDSQKLAEPEHKAPLDPSKGDAQKYLMGRIANLIELSVGAAVTQSEIGLPRGNVEVGPVKEVDPKDTKR